MKIEPFLKIWAFCLIIIIGTLNTSCQTREFQESSSSKIQSESQISRSFNEKYVLELKLSDVADLADLENTLKPGTSKLFPYEVILINLENMGKIKLLINSSGNKNSIQFTKEESGKFKVDFFAEPDLSKRKRAHLELGRLLIGGCALLALVCIGVPSLVYKPCDLQKATATCENNPSIFHTRLNNSLENQNSKLEPENCQRDAQKYCDVQNAGMLGMKITTFFFGFIFGGMSLVTANSILKDEELKNFIKYKMKSTFQFGREKSNKRLYEFFTTLQDQKNGKITNLVELIRFLSKELKMPVNPEIASFAPDLASLLL